MSKIRIKNFGPIKAGLLENDGWMDIKKVTLFIGNQGSGKSTLAKLISTFTWIEKALTRGDYDSKHFERKNKLKNLYLKYHRLENYFSNSESDNSTLIEYIGHSFKLTYKQGNLSVEDLKNGHYPLPQIMYVPAERNFIANVKKAKALNLTSDALIEFVTEYNNALNLMKGGLKLPINEVDVEYNKSNDVVYLKGKDFKIKLSEASSGFQSVVPLYLVSKYLGNSVKLQSESEKELMSSEQRERFRNKVKAILNSDALTEEQKRIAISEEAKKFNKTAFVNIVEEPEQNLFPSSQRKLLNSLLEINNVNEANKLVITTHSPYLINYLTLAVKANSLINNEIKTLVFSDVANDISKIVPLASIIKSSDLAIYELNESNGTVKLLENYMGLPSDENYLNVELAESNELFAQLLQMQQTL
jgi:predicted ATPase